MEILTKKELGWEGWDVKTGYYLQIRNNKVGRVSGWPKVSQEGIAYPSEREQFVLRESQSHSCRQEEQTTRTVTLWPGALGKQTAWSGWRPMCFSCFSPPVPWYQKKTQEWRRWSSARSQHGRSHPRQGHAEETWQARQIRTRRTPWTCLRIYPKTRICLS